VLETTGAALGDAPTGVALLDTIDMVGAALGDAPGLQSIEFMRPVIYVG